MNKLETLKFAFQGRNEEIMGYQINIDNYIRAIAKINAEYASNPAMIEFRDWPFTKNHEQTWNT